jgi:UDP-glucose 4-epimerase
MRKIRYLETGCAGKIGSHSVLALKDAGWPVAVVDDLSNGTREVVPVDVPFFAGNIADRRLVDGLLREQQIGAIMHFAGSIVVPESVEQPLKYYANNTLASHALISAALESGVKHILFSSTAAVYGAPEQVPIVEEDPKQPINPYGASKLMTERMLEDASAAHPFNFGALRYFNVAGADPQGRTGQMGKGSTHLIKVAAEAAVGKRPHVAVYGTDYATPDGTCIRDYIHVSDLAAAHVAALDWLTRHPGENLIMNCGYGKGLSVFDVLDAVDRHTNLPVKRVLEGRRPGDPPELVAGNEKLRKTLDWQARYADIDRIVGDAIAWERKLLEIA